MISLETIFSKNIEEITPQEEDYLKSFEGQLSDEAKEKYKTQIQNSEIRNQTTEPIDEEKDEEKKKVPVETKQITVNELIEAFNKIKTIINKIV